MNSDQFDEYQKKLLEEVVGMGQTKGKEYAHSEDRFANFNRLAVGLDIPSLTIAWIYTKKHLDGIESYVKEGKTFSTEGIRGRIIDAIVYLTLIGGMIEEESKVIPQVCTNCGGIIDTPNHICKSWEDGVKIIQNILKPITERL